MTSHAFQTRLDLTALVTALEQPLQLLGEPEVHDRMQAYVNAARPQVERVAFDVLATAVSAFNRSGAYQRAGLEYVDGGLRLRIEETQDAAGEAPAFNDGELERVTIRLPRELKELIDTAAERHGISANTWYVRALSRAAARHMRDISEHGEQDGQRGRRRRRGFYRGRGGNSPGLDGENAD